MTISSDASNSTPLTGMTQHKLVRKTHARPLTPRKVVYVIGGSTLSEQAFKQRVRKLCAVLVILLLLIGSVPLFGDQLRDAAAPLIRRFRDAMPPMIATPTTETLPAAPVLPTTTPTVPAPELTVSSGTSRVQVDDVNLRLRPGADEPQITVLYRGTLVEVLGDAQRVGESIWIRVRTQETEGWVNQRYIIPADQYVPDTRPRARVVGVSPERLLVRAQPSRSGDVRGRLGEGAEVALIEPREVDGTTWWMIAIDGLEGWANGTYLAPLP